MKNETITFRYSGWLIPQMTVVVSLGIFGVWRLVAHTPISLTGQVILVLLTAIPIYVVAANVTKIWERVTIDSHKITKSSLLRQTSIIWSDVAAVKTCHPLLQEAGVKIISKYKKIDCRHK